MIFSLASAVSFAFPAPLCGKQEHSHGEHCYNTSTPICGNEDLEHEHSIEAGCYELICDQEEHHHNEDCNFVRNGVDTLVALPDYMSVTLLWEPVTGATSYDIARTDGYSVKKITPSQISYKGKTYCSYRDSNNSKGVTYSYQVYANMSSPVDIVAEAKVAKAARVRTAYYKIKFKKAVTLKSHDSAKKKYKFKKGQTVTAEGFGSGRYKFNFKVSGVTRPYEAKRIRMTGATVNYSPNAYFNDYSELIAVNFVTHRGCVSSTKKMIWANLYSQRVFVLQKTSNGWQTVQNFACGSGKAKTPSPTGWSKSIGVQMKNRKGHGKKYWSTYSNWNSFHNGLPDKAAKNNKGYLVSSGCIRMSTTNAKWVMENVPKKSRVVVF